ncbi:MAG: efflux RND transporter periplasmic adaptor subunit [Bacteroidales bacterium]|nr:efflux RND transporter periplasmic adaptor subunit [Bacteroidales bacterium]
MSKVFIISLLVVFTACHTGPHTNPGEPASSHQHNEEGNQYTLFSGQFEFFIEHPPLEAGKEAEFLVHLTDLTDYKACSTGRVSILIDGVTVTSGEAGSPGIFHVPYTPRKAGAFHAEFVFNNGSVSQSAEQYLHVYEDHGDIHAGESEDVGHAHEAGVIGEIEFLKEQAWQSEFMVSKIDPAPFHAVIPTSGELMAMPGENKNITASSPGIVRFTNPFLVQGSKVKKGQMLFTLSSENLLEDNVKLRYEEARNRLEKSRSEYQRHLALFKKETISERQFLESRASFVEDSLRYYHLAHNFSEGGVKVTAPVSGTIHELLVSDGEYTEAGELLATLSTNRTLMLRADLPQQYYDQLNDIRSAHFRPAYSKQVFTVEEMSGTLLAAGVSVAENDHYLPVIFRLQNDGHLLEGAFAEVFLQAKEKSNILSVPLTALAEEQGGHYLYVQLSGESYTKRFVSTGGNNGLEVEITGGLQAGERVVTRGVMLVKAASLVSGVVGDGHSH